jgi:NTE family protein
MVKRRNGPNTRGGGANGRNVKPINLALQGGGAHGAYTWGVLDRLLEEESLEIEGISGTSAGAINAAVLATGYSRDGRAGARAALDHFWQRVSEVGRFGPVQRTPWDRAANGWNLDHSPLSMWFDTLTRLFSPYQLNPWNYHPLRDLLEEVVDYRVLRTCPAIKLFVSATNVRTGKIKVFTCDDLSTSALLASSCLPYLFQAVEVDGEHYWDGGYMGNPAIYPLIYGCKAQDVIIVQVNPIERPDLPTTAAEILNRLNEISFNSSLMREMRAIAFVGALIEKEKLDHDRYKRMRVHWIEGEEHMRDLGVFSKLNADWEFLTHLKALGRATTESWLAQHYAKIGIESSIDIREKFL